MQKQNDAVAVTEVQLAGITGGAGPGIDVCYSETDSKSSNEGAATIPKFYNTRTPGPIE